MFLTAGASYGQGGRVDGVAFARSGQPAPGATIAVCTQPAVTTTTPCSPLATLYTDRTLATPCAGVLLPPSTPGSPCSNPMIADGLGNYHFYFQPGTYYTIQFYGAGITPSIAPDQALPGGLFTPNSQNITFNGNLIFNGTATFTNGITTNAIRVTGLTPLQCVQTDASSNLITVACPAGGGSVTSVGLSMPVQFNITGGPVTTSGVLNAAWNDAQPSTFLRGPMPNGYGGTFDGLLQATGTSTTPTAGPLTPTTTHDMAWFIAETIGAQGSFTMPGPWVSQQTNGNIGGVFSNTLSTASPVTAQVTDTSSQPWAGLLFFLKYTVATTPAVVQKKSTSGGIVDGASVTMTSNTAIGNALLAVVIGTPASANFSTGTFTDSQNNNFTPIGQTQNGANAVVLASLALNLTGVTTDQITFHTTAGTFTSAVLVVFEVSNIQAADRTPFFGPIVQSDLTALAAFPAVQSWQQTLLGGDVSVSATTVTTVMSRAVTMPAVGCPCRAFISYSVWISTASSGAGYATWIDDGTAVMAPVNTGQSNASAGGATSATYGGFSTVTYANGAAVTFTLKTEGDHTYTVKAAPINGGGPNSSLQVSIMTSN